VAALGIDKVTIATGYTPIPGLMRIDRPGKKIMAGNI